jgi:hypothetical protein
MTNQADGRLEQRALLRREEALVGTTMLVRGGSDTHDKLRRHIERTARAWALDGRPLLGISVFAVVHTTLTTLLRRRFTNFRMIYLPSFADFSERGFELMPTGQRPHFTVRLREATDTQVNRLLAALGDAQPNPQYARGRI